MNVNELTLVGRIVRDPRYAETQNGEVADFRLAVTTVIRKANGDRVKDTLFMDCEVWGKRSEYIRDRAHKGDLMYVSGRLSRKNYKTTKGEEKSKYLVKVDKFQLYQKPENFNKAEFTEKDINTDSTDVEDNVQ